MLELCFSISPSKEYSALISFRMDWLDLLTVQGIKSTTEERGVGCVGGIWHSRCVAEKGPAAAVPFPVLLLLSHFFVTAHFFFFFWCCKVIVPCPPFLSFLFRSSRKASLTPSGTSLGSQH